MNPLPPDVASIRETVKAWERLRLVYNAVLLVAGLAVATMIVVRDFPPFGPFPNTFLDLVFGCLCFGIGANLCFCLGPYAEFIVIALGFPVTARKWRYVLFGLGLFMSLGLIAIVALLLPFAALPAPVP